jgi:hypothetical protein
MAKKTAFRTSFTVSRPWQLLFIVTMFLMWLSPLFYLVFWMSTSYISAGSLFFQITNVVVPFVWLGLALWLIWDMYKTFLTRLFVSTFVATVGYVLYSSLTSIEEQLRFKFYPPTINTSPGDTSWLTAFGHEWLLAAIGIGIFAALVLWKKYRKHAV